MLEDSAAVANCPPRQHRRRTCARAVSRNSPFRNAMSSTTRYGTPRAPDHGGSAVASRDGAFFVVCARVKEGGAQGGARMFADIVAFAATTTPVIAFLLWREHVDRRHHAAQMIRADVHAGATRALGGETVLAI